MKRRGPSTAKTVAFTAAMVVFIVSIPLAAVAGYYVYRKLTFSYTYCGSYGAFDDELGWRLRENASSCLVLKNYLSGRVFFDSTIHTNRLGFRDVAPASDVPVGAYVAIGDSWTFGYGVNQEASYPHQLAELLGVPVVNMGVPAYGSGSTLLLFARHVDALRPRAVVYFAGRLWSRSICDHEAPEETLVPCFRWRRADDRVELLRPRPGAVARAVAAHRYPGGALTAGYDSTWRYAFLDKPREVLRVAADRVRILAGVKGPNMSDDEAAARTWLPHVLRAELGEFARLARTHSFALLLIDPGGWYEPVVAEARGVSEGRLYYIGPTAWQTAVATPMERLAPDDRAVPGDGHWGRGTNRLVAQMIARALRDHGLAGM